MSAMLALLDDISLLADDVAAVSKSAAHKTSAILGDDLAVNAEKSSKFSDDRELPVIWAITKGAFLNKLYLLPALFALSYFLPIMVTILLIIGACYLGFEGFEKVYHILMHKDEEHAEKKESEAKKIKSAIMIDFILSIEIIIIAMSTVLDKPFMIQVMAVTLVSFGAVIFVYGIVALLVRMDNAGFWIQDNYEKNKFLMKVADILIKSLPIIIKILGVVGTVAMFLVAGSIIIHNIEFVHHYAELVDLWLLEDLIAGLILGGLVFLLVEFIIKSHKIVKGKTNV